MKISAVQSLIKWYKDSIKFEERASFIIVGDKTLAKSRKTVKALEELVILKKKFLREDK